MFSQELNALCQSASNILITGPESLDGDSIGACIALQQMIHHISTANVDVFGIPTHQYIHLNGIDSWKHNCDPKPHYDVAIVVDGNRHRLHPIVEKAFDQATTSVLIDHHKSTDSSIYDLAYLEPTAASTCSMVYELLQDWDIPINQNIAEALYVGLIFDTGGFQHSNTSSAVHQMASELIQTGFDANTTYIKVIKEKRPQGWQLQSHMFANSTLLEHNMIHTAFITQQTMNELDCNDGDIEGLVNDLRCTAGVHFAILVIEKDSGEVKVSLRSNPTINDHCGVDCAAFAQSLSIRGGGHARAAGATVRISQSFQKTYSYIQEQAIVTLKGALQ